MEASPSQTVSKSLQLSRQPRERVFPLRKTPKTTGDAKSGKRRVGKEIHGPGHQVASSPEHKVSHSALKACEGPQKLERFLGLCMWKHDRVVWGQASHLTRPLLL